MNKKRIAIIVFGFIVGVIAGDFIMFQKKIHKHYQTVVRER